MGRATPALEGLIELSLLAVYLGDVLLIVFSKRRGHIPGDALGHSRAELFEL